MRSVPWPEPLGNKFLDHPADQVGADTAEHPLGFLVRQADASVGIDLQDRIRSRFDKFAKSCIHNLQACVLTIVLGRFGSKPSIDCGV